MLRLCMLALILSGTAAAAPPAQPPRPRLVLQITIDQLRGDLPTRQLHRFDGGLALLFRTGVHYANAHYVHANTETAPGHATLATGGVPRTHGIVSNEWYDQGTGSATYAVEDAAYHQIGREPRPHEGSSPKLLLSTTFGDELHLATAGRSKSFAVSGKDRAAILTAGRSGKAFWYDKSSGLLTSSTYYYDALPAWAQAFNDTAPAEAYRDAEWGLLHDRSTYVYGQADDMPWERGYKHLGITMPKALDAKGQDYTKALSSTPFVDEITVAFVKALIDAEELGADDTPDYLSVSLSSTDYIGHAWGPTSLEAEDNLLRLDRTLGDLLAHVDAKVGLEHTLIVLSADHGGDEVPELSVAHGYDAGRHDTAALLAQLDARLAERTGQGGLIAAFYAPYLFLDEVRVAEASLDLREVASALADVARDQPGIYDAVSGFDALSGPLAPTAMHQRIARNFHVGRSGHVHVVPDQHWFLYQDPWSKVIAQVHGSPWDYDTFVPIVFAGAGLSAQVVHRAVGPHDIAPTLSAWLGLKAPSGSVGTALVEVLRAPEPPKRKRR